MIKLKNNINDLILDSVRPDQMESSVVYSL